MRFVLLSLAAVSLIAATPALAGEGRVEVHGGVIWNQGDSEAVAGVGAGYDFDLGSTVFAGPEVAADKTLASDTRVSFGFGGRAGIRIAEAGKLYVASAYQTKDCKFCEDSVSLGAGYEHEFAGNLFGKIEYRHYFSEAPEPDAVTVGLGVTF
jgi:hypothetical protein